MIVYKDTKTIELKAGEKSFLEGLSNDKLKEFVELGGHFSVRGDVIIAKINEIIENRNSNANDETDCEIADDGTVKWMIQNEDYSRSAYCVRKPVTPDWERWVTRCGIGKILQSTYSEYERTYQKEMRRFIKKIIEICRGSIKKENILLMCLGFGGFLLDDEEWKKAEYNYGLIFTEDKIYAINQGKYERFVESVRQKSA